MMDTGGCISLLSEGATFWTGFGTGVLVMLVLVFAVIFCAVGSPPDAIDDDGHPAKLPR